MINVFPNPKIYEEKEGEFLFGNKVYLIMDESFSNEDFCRLCPELWHNYTANMSELEIVPKKMKKGVAVLAISDDAAADGAVMDEAYEYGIDCDATRMVITYAEEVGLIHAFSTILQLLGAYRIKSHDFSVPCFKVKDKPSLKFRGMHFFIPPEVPLLFVKKMVRLMGLMKCSHIVLEIWGMVKLESFPYFHWPFAYEKKDWEPIFSDGRALGIEFIPMFNHYGHASFSRFKSGKHLILDQAPEYEELFEPGGWTWNVKNPMVLELQESLRWEYSVLFGAGEYFHIGCDEVFVEDKRRNGLDRDDNDTFVRFLNHTAEKVCAMGRKPIMWGDMFLKREDFLNDQSFNISHRCEDTERNLSALDSRMLIDDWQYNVKEDVDDSVRFFASRRDLNTLILSPWEGYENIAGRCALARKHGLLGVLGTTWHSVQNEPRFAGYTASVMWDKDESYTDMCTWETLKVMMAQNIRKLVPPRGNYEDSGFRTAELCGIYY